MENLKSGLVLGKFAPLHKGHQFLIETAIKNSDRVTVLIYDCPEVIDIPLKVRAGWIRKIYPNVTVVEGYNGPKETGHEPAIMRLQEEYIKKVIPFTITHFFSSEWYGDHVSRALNAKNIVVDEKRTTFPISGTLVRSNPYKYKNFVHPMVYKDLIKKVVFLGAESTGKTTLAKALAEKFDTVWVPEYGREYWQKNHGSDGKVTLEQLVEIAKGHLESEEIALPQAKNFLIVDTNALTTAMFSRFYHNAVHPELEKITNEIEDRYHHIFVCDIDIPYDDDNGTRNGAEHRLVFQKQIINDLKERGLPFTMVRGDLDQRIKTVEKKLSAVV